MLPIYNIFNKNKQMCPSETNFVVFCLLYSPVQASSGSQPACLGSIYRCILFFHSGYILMEHFAVLVRVGSYISREKKKTWDCRKWSFNDMSHRKAHSDESRSSIISTYSSDFLFPKKLLHTFSNASQALFSAKFNWFLKSGSWNSCFT
jgi:hypothetical protein